METISVGDQVAFIDDEDLNGVIAFEWWLLATKGLRYATSVQGNRTIYMHRVLLGLTYGDSSKVDHIDRNGLNNQRSNLRVVSHAQNKQNVGANKTWNGKTPSSQYRGVTFSKKDKLWVAKAQLNYKHIKIGYFKEEEQAGRVAAEWRRQNMPYSVEVNDIDPQAQIWLEEANARRKKQ